MSGPETLSRSERIRSEIRIGTLFKEGRRGNVYPVRYCWRAVDRQVADDCAADTGEPSSVSVMFSVPKKVFRRAWKRNLIKRRLRESYRRQKHELMAMATAAGRHIDIAFICVPEAPDAIGKAGTRAGAAAGSGVRAAAGAEAPVITKTKNKGPRIAPEIPDFKMIDNAVAKILEQIAARC